MMSDEIPTEGWACADGYVGTPVVEMCTGDNTPYVLSGCTKLPVCTSPSDQTGYTVIENELITGDDYFDVQVSCASGYTGTAKVEECTEDNLSLIHI